MEGRQASRNLTEGTVHGMEGRLAGTQAADNIVSIVRKHMG